MNARSGSSSTGGGTSRYGSEPSRWAIMFSRARRLSSLSRIAGEGWLASERVGRRVRWALTPPGRRLLTEGAQRIDDFGSGERAWPGTWLVVLVSVPEAKRDLRHRVRTRLSWAGLGSPEPGVWITPGTAAWSATASTPTACYDSARTS